MTILMKYLNQNIPKNKSENDRKSMYIHKNTLITNYT